MINDDDNDDAEEVERRQSVVARTKNGKGSVRTAITAERLAIKHVDLSIHASKRKAIAEDISESANSKKPKPTLAKKKATQAGFIPGFKPTPGPVVSAKKMTPASRKVTIMATNAATLAAIKKTTLATKKPAPPVRQPAPPVKNLFRDSNISVSPDPSAISISSSASSLPRGGGRRVSFEKEATEELSDDGGDTKIENNDSRIKVDPFLYGGLVDEDETLEKAAAPSRKLARTGTSMPTYSNWDAVVVKRAQRKANNVRVVANTSVAEQSVPFIKHPKGTPQVVYHTRDLPSGTQTRWVKVLIPAWRNYIGTFDQPWDISNLVAEIQELWDLVFPDAMHHHVVLNEHDVVYDVAMQRIYEWRGSFAKHALAAVEAYWETDPMYANKEERARFAKFALGDKESGIPCLWGKVDDSDPYNVKFSRPFQSSWVFEVLAHHYAVIADVSDDLACQKEPHGALILTCVAFERAFTMWLTGDLVHSETKAENYFSEVLWGKSSLEFAISIQKLSMKTWKAISDGAKTCIKGKRVAIVTFQPEDVGTSARTCMGSDNDSDSAVGE